MRLQYLALVEKSPGAFLCSPLSPCAAPSARLSLTIRWADLFWSITMEVAYLIGAAAFGGAFTYIILKMLGKL